MTLLLRRLLAELLAVVDDAIAGLLLELGEHVGQRRVVHVERHAASASTICSREPRLHLAANPRQPRRHFLRHVLAGRRQQREKRLAAVGSRREPQLDERLLRRVALGRVAVVELRDELLDLAGELRIRGERLARTP